MFFTKNKIINIFLVRSLLLEELRTTPHVSATPFTHMKSIRNKYFIYDLLFRNEFTSKGTNKQKVHVRYKSGSVCYTCNVLYIRELNRKTLMKK